MMKRINEIRLLVLLLCSTVMLFSCEKETEVETKVLEIDQTAIEIQEGYPVTVSVVSGNGGYEVSETDLVEVAIDENSVTFTATDNYGEERLFIRDAAGKQVALDVKVIPAVLGSDDPRFYWDSLIALEQPNGWATTVMGNKVAITNIEEKQQFALSWNGEFEVGVKPRGVLRILSAEAKEEIGLSKFEILSIDRSKNLCTIVFFDGNKKGELVFVLP